MTREEVMLLVEEALTEIAEDKNVPALHRIVAAEKLFYMKVQNDDS